jgi:hypothetical protein
VMSCEHQGALSCECIRQCVRLRCGLLNNGTKDCALVPTSLLERGCWHWPGRPAEQQLSDVPEEGDAEVKFYKQYKCVCYGVLCCLQPGTTEWRASACCWPACCAHPCC